MIIPPLTDEEIDRLGKTPNWTNEQMSHVLAEMRRLGTIADALLMHCDKEGGECSVCSKIVCPYGDEMHFHHDGCPSCAEHDPEVQIIITTEKVQ